MRKKSTFTNVTPIPSTIPRQLAIDILHSHGEIITLNPLVTNYSAIKAPRDAPADEYYSTWYEIEERVQFVPGIGKMGSGMIKFKGCFHDIPWGLQTHIYAPMNVDLRNNWRIAGNQPDEPRETAEIGIGAPSEGLYLREDVEIRCNVAMVSFVKKEMKAASKILVARLIKKAELLDAGVLHAMFENGRLKTINPADRTATMTQQPQLSPGPYGQDPSFGKMQYQVPQSPTRSFAGGSVRGRYGPQPPRYEEQAPQNVVMELPGDYYHYNAAPEPQRPRSQQQYQPQLQQPQQQPQQQQYQPQLQQQQQQQRLKPGQRQSYASELPDNSPTPNAGRWSGTASEYQSSASSRPTSYATEGGLRSPRLEQAAVAPDLNPMREEREEYDRLMGR